MKVLIDNNGNLDKRKKFMILLKSYMMVGIKLNYGEMKEKFDLII